MITRNFKICLNAGVGSAPHINVSQYDSGETWVFELFTETGEAYTPTTGSIVGIKSDGMVIANAGTVTDGKIVINETQQMTASAGKATYELQIDGDTHGTANFTVMVEKSPMDGGVMSESDVSKFEGLLNITPSNSGTAGQVLTRTANGAEWSDGGSGGTSDYTDLTNKPRINNVELNGNKSLADLGIVIPTVPVQSVNGKTGSVMLNASDVGALPSTTVIPSKTSELQNDSGFLTSAPVSSVNGQTGAVIIANATTSANGLMSAQDKGRLDALYDDYSSAMMALGV